MYRVSILLFAIAAVAGVIMAVSHFRKAALPRPALAALHGVFAASGLIVLLLAVIKAGMQGAPAIALGVLVVAALGGFVLLSSHLRGRALPSGLVVGHALLAVAGFATLLAAEYVLIT
jgi:glucose uptake protein GlcU